MTLDTVNLNAPLAGDRGGVARLLRGAPTANPALKSASHYLTRQFAAMNGGSGK